MRPRCLQCEKPLPRMPSWRSSLFGYKPDRPYGAYGDNAFCTLACGHMFAVRALRSVPGLVRCMAPRNALVDLTPLDRKEIDP
jgi:hypothetical protein